MSPLTQALAAADPALMSELEALYKDLHQHPELSMQEVRTARIVADAMDKLGYEVTREVGVTGVVCVMKCKIGPFFRLAEAFTIIATIWTGPGASCISAPSSESPAFGRVFICLPVSLG